MAELNLDQIEDKLNEQFQSDERTLIFWYDAAAEFEQDIKHLFFRKGIIWIKQS